MCMFLVGVVHVSGVDVYFFSWACMFLVGDVYVFSWGCACFYFRCQVVLRIGVNFIANRSNFCCELVLF